MSLSEIESLIRSSINEKGLSNYVSDDQIEEIKKKIKAKLSMPSAGVFYSNPTSNNNDNSLNDSEPFFDGSIEEDTSDSVSDSNQNIEVPKEDGVISHETEINDVAIENAKKEKELDIKNQELLDREEELRMKEKALQKKEEELKYKPSIPNSILQASPEKLFVYDMNQLSHGGEGLSVQPYNTLDNPENKTSMHQLWIEGGKVRAEIFKVEYKKIGEMIFDPFNGTSKFVEMQQPIESDLPKEERDSVQQAIDSQTPTDPMVDSIEPVMDVTMPPSNDMGLQGTDVQKAIENTVEKILRQYFSK